MVAALSLYEDWVPFGAAVAFVLVQQGITAAIVDYDDADSPWVWALVHSAFIGALSVVCLATWRASEHDREAFRSLVESLEEGVLMVDASGRLVDRQPEREADPRRRPGALLAESGSDPGLDVRVLRRLAAARGRAPAARDGDDRAPADRGAARPAARGRQHALAVGLDARGRDRPGAAVRGRPLVLRRHRRAQRGRGARTLERRARAVRLRRLARPLRAAADGLELPQPAAPPLPRASGFRRRRVHRLRGRRRRPHALADRGAAGLLARRARARSRRASSSAR